MTHDDFRAEMHRAVRDIDHALAVPSVRTHTWNDHTARADRDYLLDAMAASERFDIDAETVADALAIAADY